MARLMFVSEMNEGYAILCGKQKFWLHVRSVASRSARGDSAVEFDFSVFRPSHFEIQYKHFVYDMCDTFSRWLFCLTRLLFETTTMHPRKNQRATNFSFA